MVPASLTCLTLLVSLCSKTNNKQKAIANPSYKGWKGNYSSLEGSLRESCCFLDESTNLPLGGDIPLSLLTIVAAGQVNGLAMGMPSGR